MQNAQHPSLLLFSVFAPELPDATAVLNTAGELVPELTTVLARS